MVLIMQVNETEALQRQVQVLKRKLRNRELALEEVVHENNLLRQKLHLNQAVIASEHAGRFVDVDTADVDSEIDRGLFNAVDADLIMDNIDSNVRA